MSNFNRIRPKNCVFKGATIGPILVRFMRALLIVTAFLLVASGAASAPLSSAEADQLARGAIRAQETGVCNIHHLRMQKKIVPIHWGLVVIEEPYYSAQVSQFPNAREYVNGGCEFEPERERVKHWRYVCPVCKRAEWQWALRHRKLDEAQWILSRH
jgi:hypothetical protein